jgi:hypothetical protein
MAARSRQRGSRLIRGGWGPILALALSGCGSTSSGTISGTVTLNRKALEGGTVIFFCENGKLLRAPIDENGAYTISEAPPGPAAIAVVGQEPMPKRIRSYGGAPVPQATSKKIENDNPPTARKRVRVPVRYHKPDTSGLTHTVEPGDQTHDIELMGPPGEK